MMRVGYSVDDVSCVGTSPADPRSESCSQARRSQLELSITPGSASIYIYEPCLNIGMLWVHYLIDSARHQPGGLFISSRVKTSRGSVKGPLGLSSYHKKLYYCLCWLQSTSALSCYYWKVRTPFYMGSPKTRQLHAERACA